MVLHRGLYINLIQNGGLSKLNNWLSYFEELLFQTGLTHTPTHRIIVYLLTRQLVFECYIGANIFCFIYLSYDVFFIKNDVRSDQEPSFSIQSGGRAPGLDRFH